MKNKKHTFLRVLNFNFFYKLMSHIIELPLCPNKGSESATTEDWQEYAINLVQSLKSFSVWIEDQIQLLSHTINETTIYYKDMKDDDEKKMKLLHFSLAEAADALIPMADLHWWTSCKEKLEQLIHTPDSPNNDQELIIFESNDSFFNPVNNNISVISQPVADRVRKVRPVVLPPSADSMAPQTPFRLVVRPLTHIRGSESETNMMILNALLHVMNLYYLDCLSMYTMKWSDDIWTHSDQKSRMNYQGMVFLEIMHLRVLRQIYTEIYTSPTRYQEEQAAFNNSIIFQTKFKITPAPRPQTFMQEMSDPDMTKTRHFSEHGAAYHQLKSNAKTFPWLHARKLIHDKPYIISDYTQSELEQTLRDLFFKFIRMEWHSELHHFVNLLMDRMAVLFYSAQSEKIMNLENMRTSLSTDTQKQINDLQGRDVSLQSIRYTYNFEFLFHCSWRYYYAMQNVLGFEQLLHEPLPLLTPIIPKQELIYPSNLKQMQVYTRDQVKTLATHIQQWIVGQFQKYSTGEYNTINEATRLFILDALVPQGDHEWVKFKYPIISRNANNIMEKIHSKVYTSIKEEVFPKEGHGILKYYMEATNPKHSLHFIHLRLILYLIDKHMVADMESLRFLTRYIIPQRDIHIYAQLLFNTQEPYIRQWMGRYYLFFNNSISTMGDTIYEVVAEWILTVQYFCPPLWKLVQEFGGQLLPKDLLQRTVHQFTLDIYNVYDDQANEEEQVQKQSTVSTKKSRLVPLVL